MCQFYNFHSSSRSINMVAPIYEIKRHTIPLAHHAPGIPCPWHTLPLEHHAHNGLQIAIFLKVIRKKVRYMALGDNFDDVQKFSVS